MGAEYTYDYAIIRVVPRVERGEQINVGVIVSSRVNDIRMAEQISGMLVLPVVLIGLPLTAAKMLVSWPILLVSLLVLVVIDAVVLLIGVQLFKRETILTRWK